MRPFQNVSRSASVAREARLGGAGVVEDRAYASDVRLHFRLDAVEFAEEDGRGVARVAGVGEVLRGLDGEGVHHLEARRDDAAPDDGRDGVAGLADVVEGGQQHALDGRLWQQLDDDFRDHAQHALRADHGGEEVVARGVEGLAAEHEFVALDGLHGDAEHVVHGEAVLQAVDAAGVLGDVAADAAGELRRGVRCVVEAVVRHRFGDREVRDARLDAGGAGVGVDLEDAVHLGQRQQDAVGEGACATRETRAGAAGYDGGVVFTADLEDGAHLLDGFGEDDDPGFLADGGQPVRLEGAQCPGLRDDAGRGQAALEQLDDAGVAHGVFARCRAGIVRGAPGSRVRGGVDPIHSRGRSGRVGSA